MSEVDPFVVAAFGPPPDGINLNEQTETRNDIITGIFLALAILSVSARWAARRLSGARLQADDYVIFASLVLCIGTAIVNILRFVYTFIWAVSVSVTKLSIILLYRRIFAVQKSAFRNWLHVLACVIISQIIAITVSNLTVCRPLSYLWDRLNPGSHGTCFDQPHFLLITGVINAVFDIVILITPIVPILRLKLSAGKKAGVFGMLLLGSGETATWSSIEASLGIVSACLPVLRPLYLNIRNGRGIFTTTSKEDYSGLKEQPHTENLTNGSDRWNNPTRKASGNRQSDDAINLTNFVSGGPLEEPVDVDRIMLTILSKLGVNEKVSTLRNNVAVRALIDVYTVECHSPQRIAAHRGSQLKMEEAFTQIKLLAKETDELGRQDIMASLHKLAYSMESPENTRDRYSFLVGFDLELFKYLAESTNALSADEVARKAGAQTELMERILRYLASINAIDEVGKQRYLANRVTKNLVEKSAEAGVCHWFGTASPQFQQLPALLKKTSYLNPVDETHTAFHEAWNTSLNPFAWFENQPVLLNYFNQYMATRARPENSWLQIYPVPEEAAGCPPDRPLYVNIGGGVGHQCAQFKEKYPALPGRVVLQDLPHSIAEALPTPGVENMVYNFFEPQPIRGKFNLSNDIALII
ncbi:hypothetical protein CHU98_g8683 [Xylaria longipes]|nr:hypothetical protein CHU98_g8683 [Xylaria longipes]